MEPYVNTLILANDVESNPVPTLSPELQQVVDAINNNVDAKFDEMQKKIDMMGQSLTEVKTDVAKMNEKVRELERNVSDEMKDVSDRMTIIECGQENIVQDVWKKKSTWDGQTLFIFCITSYSSSFTVI